MKFDTLIEKHTPKSSLTNTPQFKKWFKNSKVVDSSGNPLVVYHGTPDGGFNTFKEGTHFTGNEKYANRYQKAQASSSGVKKSGKTPETYKVYLSIKKPFDTRIVRNKEIFNNEYYLKYGTGTPLTKSGLPDWNDSTDLLDWIEETNQDFDGLILDEGGTPDGGHRGFSRVPIKPTQIKSTENEGSFDKNNSNIYK